MRLKETKLFHLKAKPSSLIEESDHKLIFKLELLQSNKTVSCATPQLWVEILGINLKILLGCNSELNLFQLQLKLTSGLLVSKVVW